MCSAMNNRLGTSSIEMHDQHFIVRVSSYKLQTLRLRIYT